MRWTAQEPPKNQDERIISCFLWFPVIIGKEYRWLEHAKIRQGKRGFYYEWENLCWEE